MALTTAQDYIDAARTLLQDTVTPYRYSNTIMLLAMQFAIDEMRRVRPDILYGVTIPDLDLVTNLSALDARYRLPIVHFVTGYLESINAENAETSRAGGFMQAFALRLGAVG